MYICDLLKKLYYMESSFMQHTDLKFFTNEPGRDLYNRFSAILKSNTQFFDILVGYFRTSGFFKLYEAMKDVEKIRILVGLNVDKFTIQIIDQTFAPQIAPISTQTCKELFSEEIEKEFAQSIDSIEVEEGVRIFIDWLKSGKLEMRMYTKAPIHAKVYIMRKNQELVPDTYGSVITGSSNFSQAGLVNNLEFNVELKDACDVKFALNSFENLWKKGIDIQDTFIETITEKTWLRDDITPYQLYIKTLYEFFKEEINSDRNAPKTLLPDGYMRLQYQIDAVTQAKQKLDAYNGVFISDVVGLGKTYICAMLANHFHRSKYKLFICPPVLVDYWRSVLQEFDVARCDVESLGKLNKIIERGTDKYSYVFVDEAHRFRNSDTEAFTELHQICRNKKVILISATPINNYTSDVENQIYLFQSKQNGTINGIKNIENFFRKLESKLNKYPKDSVEYKNQLRENSEVIRDQLIREVMVRRTRNEIQQYYADDLKKQNLTFPEVKNPEKFIYVFNEEIDEAFNHTIQIIKNFKYARYTPLLYLKDQKKFSKQLTAQRNMGGFMKGILVKRLESSFHAFRQTVNRFISSYEEFIGMAKTGKVYISKKINVYDLLDGGDEKKLLYLIEQEAVQKYNTKDFSTAFIEDLENDLAKLRTLRGIWDLIKTDPKLDKFKKELQSNPLLKKKKIIVFTESTETAEYLYEQLKDLYKERIIYYSGQSSDALKNEIEESFNPKFKSKNNDKYDLLITTDVLAEGINLHRANILINYDLPWNPTRIMQRVGRVNRVGSEHDSIHIFNFFPTAQSSEQIPLENRIMEKLQAFHDTLGEDFKYLSDQEEVSSQKLFDDLTTGLNGEESTNPELAYLAIIRQIRDNNPELYSLIKRLPPKSKTGKKSKEITNETTITFIRKGALKAFFQYKDQNSTQIPFLNAIELIKAEPDEEKISVPKDFFTHFNKNNLSFDEMLIAEKEITSAAPRIAGNDSKVIKILKAIKTDSRITDIQEEKIEKMISLWENGEIPSKISKDIVKASKLSNDSLDLFCEIENLMPPAYFEINTNQKEVVEGEKQIILSCYLQPGD